MDWFTFLLQGMLALMFLMAGVGKLVGLKIHVDGFEHWKLPQWFRVVTGVVELLGCAFLIIGFWASDYAVCGALILGVTGIGGILTHIRVKDSFKNTLPITILALLSFLLFFLIK